MSDEQGDDNPRLRLAFSTSPDFARTLRETVASQEVRLSSLVTAALAYVLDHPRALAEVTKAARKIDEHQTAIRMAGRWQRPTPPSSSRPPR